MAIPHAGKILRAGIIGCGEIVQVAHIATLGALSDRFCVTYLCDVSQQALEHCANRVTGTPPKTTTEAAELCASPHVDVVLVCNASALHVTHAIMALQNDKHVLVEKPLALCYRDIETLDQAERTSRGTVFVGYMRRYAPALQTAIQEIDYAQHDIDELSAKDQDIKRQASEEEFGVPMNSTTTAVLDLLGGLGTHDLSAMREVLGMPKKVIGATLTPKFWTALLDYGTFTLVYESGLNDVPVFDAHIEIYTDRKIVRIEYDSPYVKGLPTTVVVRERLGSDLPAAYQERRIRSTYEDAYTIEFREWYDCITQGRNPKTTLHDARQDIDLIKMLMQAAYR